MSRIRHAALIDVLKVVKLWEQRRCTGAVAYDKISDLILNSLRDVCTFEDD